MAEFKDPNPTLRRRQLFADVEQAPVVKKRPAERIIEGLKAAVAIAKGILYFPYPRTGCRVGASGDSSRESPL
jgi:hypothetical protein